MLLIILFYDLFLCITFDILGIFGNVLLTILILDTKQIMQKKQNKKKTKQFPSHFLAKMHLTPSQ